MLYTQKILSSIAIISLLLLATSCTKDDNTLSVLTEEEAVELIEASLQTSTGGIAYTTEKVAEEVVSDITLNDVCDSLYNDLFSLEYNGAITQASYAISWTYEMACSAVNVPQSLSLSASSTGSYTSPRINCTDETTTALAVAGLEPSATALEFSGSHSRQGTQELSIRTTRTATSSFNLELENLTVDKESTSIVSGTASLSLTGTTQAGAFSYTASLTFNGGSQATLLLNGNTYQIDLS